MPDIEIITWNEICEKISYDDDDRLKKNKIIEKKKQEMNKKKQEIDSSKNSFLKKIREISKCD